MFRTAKISSIKSRIYFLIVLFVILIIGSICLATYAYIVNFYRGNYNTYISETQKYCEENMQSLIKRINMQSLDIINNQEIYSYLSDKERNDGEKERLIRTFVNDKMKGMDIIERIDIVTSAGKSYICSKSDDNTETVDDGFIMAGKKYNLYLSDKIAKNSAGENFFVFGKLLKNYYTGVEAGKILFYVNENEIGSAYKNSMSVGNVCYLIKNNTVLSASDKNMIGNFADDNYFEMYDERKNLCDKYVMNLNGINLEMRTIISHKDLNESLDRFFHMLGVVFLIICVFVVFIAHLLSKKLIKVIGRLETRMVKYINGEKTELAEYRNDEIGRLEQKFKVLTEEIDGLIEKNNKEKQIQKALELEALQAQINPHFVYNAINIIRSMAIINKEKPISEACMALSNFFRISLNCGENVVSVRDEINHVQSYIEIEKLRFSGSVDVIYDIPTEIKDLKMLKILIQPLAENSIKHGFKIPDKKGIINIKAYTEGEFLYFSVSDNGIGLKGNILESEKERRGYGIYNVNERIRLCYGNECGITYEETPGGGTTAVVKIKKYINEENI